MVRPEQYSGMCDASAAVPAGTNLFIAASDEDNVLRLYSAEKPGPPLKRFDMNAFLQLQDKHLEADLEAAARIGDRAFWIGSHGRNRIGKERLNRCRFFATDITTTAGDVQLKPVGTPYKRLLDDLEADPRFQSFHLAEASLLPPKEPGALNIEGLAATPERHLLLGFRNPVPKGRALIIPMLNPDEVVQGKLARLGDPILLDLDGLGIRDMAFYEGTYVIIAGSYASGGPFEFYRWRGVGSDPQRVKIKHLNRYNPEAIIIYPDKGLREIQVLSDDGERLIDGVPGKLIKDPARQLFRSFWLTTQE